MHISLATKHDYTAISYLMQRHGKMVVTPEHLNRRDIAIQARDDSGALIGFLWCGLMANNTIGYLDKFTVMPEYAHKGIGREMAEFLASQLLKRGTKQVFGLIKHDEYHDRSATNALRMAMGGHDRPYTFVEADLAHALKELESLKG